MDQWYHEETKKDAAMAEYNRIYTDEMTRVGWMTHGFHAFMTEWDMAHQGFWEHMAKHVSEQICGGNDDCRNHSMEVFHKEMSWKRDIGREDVREFFLFVEGLAGAAPKVPSIKCVQDPENLGYSYAQFQDWAKNNGGRLPTTQELKDYIAPLGNPEWLKGRDVWAATVDPDGKPNYV